MDRQEITFAQAEGAEPLPSQLEAGQISQELRAKLWRVVYLYLENSRHYVDMRGYVMADPVRQILRAWRVDREHRAFDEFKEDFEPNVAHAKQIVLRGNYVEVFDYLQFIIRHRSCASAFTTAIDQVLKDCRAAYRIIDKTITPISEPEEVEAVRSDLAAVRGSAFSAAYSHLQAAISQLSLGEFAPTIRESIHAVESACRQLEPSATTLGPALKKLEERGLIHPSLKAAFLKLYGYSSDEEGVRHPMVLKDTASVDEAEALFMFSACVAFVGFLSRKTA